MDSAGLAQVSFAKPFLGTASSCPNSNLTLKAPAKDAAYTIDMYAPAAGVVARVDTCLNTGSFDRYGVSLNIATYNGANTFFSISGEPAATKENVGATVAQTFPCSANVAGQDNGFFKQFIFVTVGQQVTPGQRIMQLYVYPFSFFPLSNQTTGNALSTSDVSLQQANGAPACPNIFSSAIEAQLGPKYASGPSCKGAPLPPGPICNFPGPGENLVGR